MPKNPEKLSIGFLFDDSLDSNDGVAQQVKTLGRWFNSQGHKVVYFCGETNIQSWSGGKVYSLAKNIKVRFNGNRLSIPAVSSAKDIAAALKDEKPDIIHVQMPYSPVMSQRVIRRAYKKSGIVATFHILPSGQLSTIGSKLLRLVQILSLKKLDQVISVGPIAAMFAKANFGVDSVVIPNTIDSARFKTAIKPTPNVQKIVFLGRLVKRKGCTQLLEAFAILVQSHPDASLVVAGDGPERESLVRLAKRLDIYERVSFLGYVKEADKPSLLASANIACFPSLYGESFGIVLIEAMASGAGVVLAGDNPGYRSVMQNQPKLLIDVTKTKAFSERLAMLLDDIPLTAELHKWQNEHVQQYDIGIVGPQILTIYRQAIVKKSQKRHN